ncbi:hypothetical protein [Agaribacterium sp. ZY112]|uniref:hypothetical protein n=1 Tax=Agaribacterium sp. ZY112 TaxID=3233574 RepID=UPI0035239868
MPAETSSPKLAKLLVQHLAKLARSESDLWLLDADLGDSYDINSDVITTFGPRYIQAGIAEQCMVSVASGLAAMSKRPWVFSFAAFLLSRGYDQIRCGVSQMKLPVTLVGANSGITGIKNGNSHICLNDVAIISSLPHIDIWSPGSEKDVIYAVKQILERQQPAYIRLSKFTPAITTEKSQDCYWLEKQGHDVLLISSGTASEWAVDLSLSLKQSVSVSHMHINRIRPLPEKLDTIMRQPFKHIYVIEDHFSNGGLGDIVAHQYPHLTIHKIGWPQNWLPVMQSINELREQCSIDTASLRQWILEDITPWIQQKL